MCALDLKKKWNLLKAQYEKIFDAARQQFKPLKPIIAFLELIKQESNEGTVTPHNFSDDYAKLADGTKDVYAIHEKID